MRTPSESRASPDTPPGVLQVGEVPALFAARDHPRIVLITGQEVSNRTAEGASGTARPPVLLSGSRSSPASRSTCSQRSFWISDSRQPVSIRRRIAATAEWVSEPSARISSRTCRAG